MSRDMRETMLNSAASRYGAEHYRGILFLHGLRRAWPVLGVLALLAGMAGIGWLLSPAANAAGRHPGMAGAAIAGGLVMVGLVIAGVRRIRSPYRRRRFR